ncbi:hypothetical protein SAMN05216585_3815 [Pseudomonas chlororaphis]|nr:hypothetical protein SAMN05216585_3815 [Pseudomonas chlororaphis]
MLFGGYLDTPVISFIERKPTIFGNPFSVHIFPSVADG